MIIDITSPSQAYIQGTPEEIAKLSDQMNYRNSSKHFELSKHLQRSWMRDKNPDEWLAQKKEIEAQVYVNLLYKDKGRYWIRPGYIPYIKGIELSIRSHVTYPIAKPMSWEKTTRIHSL